MTSCTVVGRTTPGYNLPHFHPQRPRRHHHPPDEETAAIRASRFKEPSGQPDREQFYQPPDQL
eukprot:613815-Rhodomonas_salina.1